MGSTARGILIDDAALRQTRGYCQSPHYPQCICDYHFHGIWRNTSHYRIDAYGKSPADSLALGGTTILD